MHSSTIAASLSLISLSHAGVSLDGAFQPDICSISEECAFHNFAVSSLYQLESTQEDQVIREKHAPEQEPPNRFHPWTSEPQCLSDKNTNEEFCVYTNTNFASDRGISLFTTPRIASGILTLPAFTQPHVHAHVNNYTNPPWEIVNVPGRGNGLFATRKLHRGDEILSSTPVGIFHHDAFFPDWPQGYKYLHQAFHQLPRKTRAKVVKMAANGPGDSIMARVETNAFAGTFEGEQHFLLYPEAAKLNHDCRPNAVHHRDPTTLIRSFFASRTIEVGEEITITYTDMLETRAERQSSLNAMWGFECQCSLCSASSAEVRASDNRIRRIQELQEFLSDWSSESIGSPRLAEELLALYEEEGVHAARGTGHMFAALAYSGDADMAAAHKHARLAIDAVMMVFGEKEANYLEMEALLEDARHHWSWNIR